MRSEALERAILAAGGVAKLAEAIDVSSQAISQWEECPALRVLAVERATGVPRYQLRPDLYPPNEAVACEPSADGAMA